MKKIIYCASLLAVVACSSSKDASKKNEANVDQAAKYMKLYDLLDDHEDIQNAWDNSDIPEEIMTQINE